MPKAEIGNRSAEAAMNPSLLNLVGAFDALILIIQSERELFCKYFDPEAAIQTLNKVKAEFLEQILATARAQTHATETLRATVEQLVGVIPQGADLGVVTRALQETVATMSPPGPNPPWPSSSSSKSSLGVAPTDELSSLVARLQEIVEQRQAK